MASIKETVDAQMRNTIKAQNLIYEQTVGQALDAGNIDDIIQAFKDDQDRIGNFNVAAYRKVVNYLITDVHENDPELFSMYEDMFQGIPDYINIRNNWQAKIKDILSQDASPQDRQNVIDALDFSRTSAHNKVINLFNAMNKLADDNGLVQPYTTTHPFDSKNPNDREHVASILENHETLLETVNLMVQEHHVEAVDYRLMTPTELIKYLAQDNPEFADSIKDLGDSANFLTQS